jgi:hypothetical protein
MFRLGRTPPDQDEAEAARAEADHFSSDRQGAARDRVGLGATASYRCGRVRLGRPPPDQAEAEATWAEANYPSPDRQGADRDLDGLGATAPH